MCRTRSAVSCILAASCGSGELTRPSAENLRSRAQQDPCRARSGVTRWGGSAVHLAPAALEMHRPLQGCVPP